MRSFGGPERRLAVGLVHAERERPLDVRAREDGDEVVERRDHPVDVAADVDVRVEELGPVRQQARGLRLVALDQAARLLENVVPRETENSTRSGYASR